MSYVIQLWEQPVPASLEEAETILEQLLREDAGVPSSRLDQLVKLLWARYPRDLDTAPGDPVWADTFPRNGRTPLQVETLAIAAPHLDEVVPVIAKAATELGLVAYDPQYGTVYLPGGRRLGRAPAEALQPVAPAKPIASASGSKLIGLDEASRLFLAEMAPFMATHGFAWKRLPGGDAWARDFPGGHQRLAPLIDSNGPSAGLAVIMRANLFAVDRFVHRFTQPRKPVPTDVLFASMSDYLVAADDPHADSLFQRHGSTLRIPLNSRAKLESALGELQQILPRVFDDMRAVETVAGLWQSALAEARGQRKAHFSESIEAKLVAGAMQGSPHLDMVVAEELARYEAGLAQRRQGASAARLDMLEAEEGRTRESLARLLEFARTRVSAAC